MRKPDELVADVCGIVVPFYHCPECGGHVDFGDEVCRDCKIKLDWDGMDDWEDLDD